MANFGDFWNELKAYTPNLPTNLSKRFINRARREIYAERPWSFLFQEGSFTTPAPITAGIMTVTQGSQTVTPDATALAAITGLSNPFVTRRQLKFGSGNLIYNVSAFDGATLTIDKPYFDLNDTVTPVQTSYILYQAYYSPPNTDFLRYISVTDVTNGYELDMLKTNEQLDRWDPQRTTNGQPICIAQHAAVPVGFWDNTVNVGDPIYELWPQPMAHRVYGVVYQRRGVDFSSDSEVLPQSISMDLLMTKARMHAYEWQMTNDPSFVNGFRMLTPMLVANYMKLLQQAKVQDDEIFVTQWQPRLGARGLRWLGNYAQSHDTSQPWNMM